MTARDDWRAAYRDARRAGPSPWVRASFPRGWMVPAAKRRLQLFELTGPALPGHVAPMLALAAIYRRQGLTPDARAALAKANRANRSARFIPSPAFGA